MNLSRRTVLKVLAAGSGQIFMPSIVKAQDPIRIGVLDVFSGPLAAFGPQVRQGISLYLNQRNQMLGGRPVELFLYDTQGQANRAVDQTQRLVFENKVQILLGPATSAEALAVNGFLASKQIQVPIVGVSVAGDLTQRLSNPSLLRISSTASQATYPLADFAAKELRYSTIAIVADDYQLGYEISGGFQRVFEDAGGRITQRVWVPLSERDYTAALEQLGSRADAIFIGLSGIRGLAFIQQARRSGVRLPILANFSNVDASLLDAAQSQFGDDLVGTISSSWYLPDFEFSANRMFATSMRREFNSAPGLNAAAAYTFGAVLEQALQKLGGDIEDRQRFTETLRGSEVFDTIRGPVKFDERGNVVGIIFIAKASRISRSNTALLGNEPIKKYPFVSQFWTYDPKTFLSGPAFSREYPPAHYLER